MRILFVDDEPHILDSLKRTLHGHRTCWDMVFCACPQKALAQLENESFDLVISDIGMPVIDGLELLRRMQQSPRTREIPVIILTGQAERTLKREALELGATDLLNKPVDAADLVARIRSALRLKGVQDELRVQNENLERKVHERTRQLSQSRLNLIWRLAKASEYRDEDTGNHVVRVGCYSRAIARAMGLDRQFVERLFLTAPLHDIGKIGIPDAILLKPGKLTPDEWTVMQQHCAIGAKILREQSKAMSLFQASQEAAHEEESDNDPLIKMAASIALFHHEKWDGSGYPHRTAGEDIPLEARIVAISDVLDALLSERPYKRAFSEDEALSIIAKGVGGHFDPEVHEAFDRALEDIRQIRAEFADEPSTAETEHESCLIR